MTSKEKLSSQMENVISNFIENECSTLNNETIIGTVLKKFNVKLSDEDVRKYYGYDNFENIFKSIDSEEEFLIRKHLHL